VLLQQAIALKGSKMSTHRRRGQVKRLCQFVGGAAGSAQQADDSAAGTGKKLSVPLRWCQLLPSGRFQCPGAPLHYQSTEIK
jgi:hypothetical protein